MFGLIIAIIVYSSGLAFLESFGPEMMAKTLGGPSFLSFLTAVGALFLLIIFSTLAGTLFQVGMEKILGARTSNQTDA